MPPASESDHFPAPKIGVGFRRELEQGIFALPDSFDCLEIIAESYLNPSITKLSELDRLRERFPLIPHGLRLSVGSADRPPPTYFQSLARLLDRIDAPYHSDHLAMTASGGIELGHLSPLWYTEEGLRVVIENTMHAQDLLGRQLVLETITEPFTIPGSTIPFTEFVSQLCQATGCGILLDVTNVYINAVNSDRDVHEILRGLPLDSVRQLHIVGFGRDVSGQLFDTHSEPIQPELWSLYDEVVRLCAPDVVIIERDGNFPPIADLGAEAAQARRPFP